MAGDKVKRGFGFYLFMLLLIILAAFLVIVMVMLFSPGKSILGYKYFSYNNDEGKAYTQSTDATPVDLDFDSIDEIVVNTGSADVKISKSVTEGSKDSIIVVNTAKGFAKSSSNTDFSCSILLSTVKVEDTDNLKQVLNITVVEPEGFLYFSRNISINICAKRDASRNFENSAFTITTKSGEVAVDEDCRGLTIKDLTVSTDNGNISIANNFKKQNDEDPIKTIAFNSLYLSTNNGKVSTPCNLTVSNTAKFSIGEKGEFDLLNVTDYRGVQLVVNNGSFSAKDIVAGTTPNTGVKVLSLNNGSINIENIYSNTTGTMGVFDTNRADKLGKAKITIGSVGSLSIPYGEAVNIVIGKLRGQSLINTTSGSVTISEALTAPCFIETTSGNINVCIDDTNLNSQYAYLDEEDRAHNFESQKGKITLKYATEIKSISNIKTKGGVDIKIHKDSKFLLTLNTYNETPIKELDKNVTIELVDNEIYSYPFKVNYTQPSDELLYVTNQINVFADGRISTHF